MNRVRHIVRNPAPPSAGRGLRSVVAERAAEVKPNRHDRRREAKLKLDQKEQK